MVKFRFFTTLLLAAGLASFALASAGTVKSITAIKNEPAAISDYSSPDALASTSTFYTLRPDVRRCASPMCGGYFVKRVNQAVTRCANGRNMSECYVASIDWSGAGQVPVNRALIRGSLLTRGDRNGKYGVLNVEEVWQAATDKRPNGEFFRTRDLGLRCIAAPCLSHHESKLNSTFDRKVAGVEITNVGASDDSVSEAFKAMTSEEGVLVAGTHTTVSGPAGRAQTLNATQFYLRSTSSSTNLKPCIKTGCSGQICADETMMSTCEYRAEYACYKKAACERQANGNCGFTKTPELTSCLARK